MIPQPPCPFPKAELAYWLSILGKRWSIAHFTFPLLMTDPISSLKLEWGLDRLNSTIFLLLWAKCPGRLSMSNWSDSLSTLCCLFGLGKHVLVDRSELLQIFVDRNQFFSPLSPLANKKWYRWTASRGQSLHSGSALESDSQQQVKSPQWTVLGGEQPPHKNPSICTAPARLFGHLWFCLS